MKPTDNNAALRNYSALVDFSNLINSSLDINFTLNNILLTCFGKFHTTKGLIALLNNERIFEVQAYKGFSEQVLLSFPLLKADDYDSNEKLADFITSNKLQVYQEIKSSEGLKGLIILGARLTSKSYDDSDISFLRTIVNVGATAIENCLAVDKLKNVNRNLDSKVNQLSSLFDLGKEFSGVLQIEQICKLLVYSLIGQMLVSKYAVVSFSGGAIIFLENRFDEIQIRAALKVCSKDCFQKVYNRNELTDELKSIAEAGVDLIVPMQIKNETKGLILLGKRKNELAYSKSDIEFVSSVGSLAIISIENARLFKETLEKQRLEKDLETARNIQNNLLPKFIPTFSNFEIAAFNKSAKMVGGDYYDIIKLDEDQVLIAIADVSGKGVPAALLMANIQAFLKSICKMKLPLAEATNLLNDLVAENTSMGSFITFFWGIINNENMELTFVNAGHNPPLLIRNNRITKLKKGGMILGVMPTVVPYLSDTIKLESGDAVVLFTDGITEAMNVKWEEYSDDKLEYLTLQNSAMDSIQLLDEIKTSVELFTIGAEQSDDITCMIVKVI
ncbi:MAG: protein serine/threonine phosphatase [Ignavibacteria bacterium]|nr:MAG: protein serine/threonine phosphatase [Ignavibacteria bacterium]KAF0160412.1 MAG: protein serine/threonine phosphatase [Ignavibacteria bacterium]